METWLVTDLRIVDSTYLFITFKNVQTSSLKRFKNFCGKALENIRSSLAISIQL